MLQGVLSSFVFFIIPQVLWKVYEYVFGTTLFMESLGNASADLILGFLGVVMIVTLQNTLWRKAS